MEVKKEENNDNNIKQEKDISKEKEKDEKNENKEKEKEKEEKNKLNNNNAPDNLYLKQENELMEEYVEKKNKIKNTYDLIYDRYKQSQDFYKMFVDLVKDYKLIILKNIDNLNNLLNKYFQDNENKDTASESFQREIIKREFKEIINNQIKAENDKINQLNFETITKNIKDDMNKSQIILDYLNLVYKAYINSINEIQKKNLKYIKYFNKYEMRLIDIVSENIKNKDLNNKDNQDDKKDNECNDDNEINNENDIDKNINSVIQNENERNEFHEMTLKLIKKEKKYKKLLEEYDRDIIRNYSKFKENIDKLSKYHNDFNEQENRIFTFIYLGYIISMETQNSYHNKKCKFENLACLNYQNYKELNQLFEHLSFEKYNTIVISSNKDDNHLCKEIPPEIIIKLSNIINYYFPYIPKLEDGDYEDPILRIIKTVVDKMFKGEYISENEENKFINVLRHDKYRIIFLKLLNKYRAKGKFLISGRNLIIMGNAMTTIIDLYEIKKGDFEVLKLIIIMSQTYFTLNDKKEKIYLIRFIEDHNLFQSEELWEFYIEESMAREIAEKEKGKIEKDDPDLDEESKLERLSNMHFGVFLSVTQNLLEFQIDKHIIRKILVNLINKKYNLIPMHYEQLLSLIEETVYIEKQKFDINFDILGKERK
jgi:hypothetical protein